MFAIKYVIADIHGEFDKFLEMLELIEFGDTDQLYILGDIIDRGPKSLELIEFCMENEDNIELLLGNHEDLTFLARILPPSISGRSSTLEVGKMKYRVCW